MLYTCIYIYREREIERERESERETCIHMCMYIYMYIYPFIYIYIYMYIYICICLYGCLYSYSVFQDQRARETSMNKCPVQAVDARKRNARGRHVLCCFQCPY